MLKILQARLQQYRNREIPDVQAGFRKGRGTRDQIANIYWIIKKAREFQKKHLFLLCWLCQSLYLCGSPQTRSEEHTSELQSLITISFRLFHSIIFLYFFALIISVWLSKKQESSRKTSISALLTMPNPLTVQITINCGKFWKRWEYQTTWPASWETYM